MKYIKPEHRDYYREKYQTKHNDKVIFSHEDREFLTAKMQRFNLFKRLDSSIAAFHQTLTRLLAKIDSFIAVLEAGASDLIYDENSEEETESASLDYKYDIKVAHLKREEYLIDLGTDRFLIQEILKESQQILDEQRDNKLQTLTEIIEAKVSNTPYNDGNKKILIFSAFADTTRYLYAQLDPLCRTSGLTLAMISGTDKPKVNNAAIDHSFNSILSAFSPKAKLRHELPPEKQVDILIGTDCLSEGQNLQDCDCVINYDVQWNPVSLIQRFGRIDRIGSVNTRIKMINFFPDLALNEYLDLENRVKAKMVTANLSSTGGDDILSPEMNDISFRSRQLARLKDEVIDLEDTNENLSLTDLNMNEYLYELAEYLKKTPDLTTTPTGIYSIASAAEASATILPENADGVLFCFKHKNIFEKPKSDSSLYPYYLVYVARDGTIRLGNNQARESLKFLRKACVSQSQPISELVAAMLTETDNCKDMEFYSKLLSQGIQSIQSKEAESSEDSVFDFGGFNNPFAEEEADDFELISFLIVRP